MNLHGSGNSAVRMLRLHRPTRVRVMTEVGQADTSCVRHESTEVKATSARKRRGDLGRLIEPFEQMYRSSCDLLLLSRQTIHFRTSTAGHLPAARCFQKIDVTRLMADRNKGTITESRGRCVGSVAYDSSHQVNGERSQLQSPSPLSPHGTMCDTPCCPSSLP